MLKGISFLFFALTIQENIIGQRPRIVLTSQRPQQGEKKPSIFLSQQVKTNNSGIRQPLGKGIENSRLRTIMRISPDPTYKPILLHPYFQRKTLSLSQINPKIPYFSLHKRKAEDEQENNISNSENEENSQKENVVTGSPSDHEENESQQFQEEIKAEPLTSAQNTESLPKEEKYLSNFSRLMHVGRMINNFYNFVAKLLPEFGEDNTREDNLNQTLQTYQDSREMLRMIIYQYTELATEVDDLYAEIDEIELATEEALDFFGFQGFYKHIRETQNSETKVFCLLQGKIEAIVLDYKLKMKKMLKAIYNFRHLDQFLYEKIKPYAKDYSDEHGLEDDTAKINQGVKMVGVYLGIKEQADGFLGDIKTGLEVSGRIRADLLLRLRQMNNISVMPEEEIEEITKELGNNAGLLGWVSLLAVVVLALIG